MTMVRRCAATVLACDRMGSRDTRAISSARSRDALDRRSAREPISRPPILFAFFAVVSAVLPPAECEIGDGTNHACHGETEHRHSDGVDGLHGKRVDDHDLIRHAPNLLGKRVEFTRDAEFIDAGQEVMRLVRHCGILHKLAGVFEHGIEHL